MDSAQHNLLTLLESTGRGKIILKIPPDEDAQTGSSIATAVGPDEALAREIEKAANAAGRHKFTTDPAGHHDIAAVTVAPGGKIGTMRVCIEPPTGHGGYVFCKGRAQLAKLIHATHGPDIPLDYADINIFITKLEGSDALILFSEETLNTPLFQSMNVRCSAEYGRACLKIRVGYHGARLGRAKPRMSFGKFEVLFLGVSHAERKDTKKERENKRKREIEADQNRALILHLTGMLDILKSM